MTLYMFYSELYQAEIYWYGSLTVVVQSDGECQVFRDVYQDDEENATCFYGLCADSF